MSSNCNHPTCMDSPVCRRTKKPKKVYKLKRTPIKKKAYKIRNFSKKRQKVNKEQYAPVRDQYILDNPVCKIMSPVCTHKTDGVHHVKGRATIRLLLDKRFWMPACNACNLWCETNSKEAKELGFKKPNYE